METKIPLSALGEYFGPEQVDQMIRQAVNLCWMTLPESRRDVGEMENQIRRLVDRAITDFREDREAFGVK